MFPWYVFSSSTSSNESATLDFVSYYVEDKEKIEAQIKYNQSVDKVISAKWSACQSGMKDWIMGEGKLLFSFPQTPIFSAF